MSKLYYQNYDVVSKVDKKILLLSDIHYHNKEDINVLNNILDKVKENHYDYLCISGDLLDKSFIEDEELLVDWFKSVAHEICVIVGIGNHEQTNDRKTHAYEINLPLYKKISAIKNVHVLDNEVWNDKDICFIGLTLPIEYYYQYSEDREYFIKYTNNIFKDEISDKKVNVLLCHTPVPFKDKEIVSKVELLKNIDIVLSGHMHGGITPRWMRKILGGHGLIGPFKDLFPAHAYGMFKRDNMSIIVSSGITKASSVNLFHALDGMFAKEMTVVNIKKG